MVNVTEKAKLVPCGRHAALLRRYLLVSFLAPLWNNHCEFSAGRQEFPPIGGGIEHGSLILCGPSAATLI
jgi:hypothetical protein